ncbi:MAG: nuclear transport factor 2 family protein [Acidobacteria bacterium]|nr:nuclear transport factor 2 family protein [Acidobacteriota bacterium]
MNACPRPLRRVWWGRASKVLILLALAVTPREAHPQAVPSMAADEAVRTVVDDYVGLYRRDTLAEWRTLFLPTFTSISTNPDGSITVRSLDEFYDSQARGFARAKDMSETLENIVIERSGRMATAWADFVFHQDGTSRRGRLLLTLVQTGGHWRIAGLLFSY